MRNPTQDKKGSVRLVVGGAWHYGTREFRRPEPLLSNRKYYDISFRLVRNRQ